MLLIFLFVNLMLEFLSLSEILARVIRAPHCVACTLMECRTQIKHCGHSHTILELQLNIWSSSFLKRKSGSSASWTHLFFPDQFDWRLRCQRNLPIKVSYSNVWFDWQENTLRLKFLFDTKISFDSTVWLTVRPVSINAFVWHENKLWFK